MNGKEEAEKWVRDKLWYLYGPNPTETFHKGESFRGILFVRFQSKGDRDAGVRLLKDGRFEEGGRKIWAKPDEELKVRVIKNLVFDTKNLLIGWDFDKKGIWADPETGGVWLGDDMVLKGTVEDKTLNVEYGKDWEAYMNDSKHPEFQELLASIRAKLATGGSPTKGIGKRTAKGKGKSKTGGSGK